MKKIVIICVLAIAITICLGVFITGFFPEINRATTITPIKTIENPRTISGEQINVFSGMFGNITIDVAIPDSPHDMRIYRGYFRPGDRVEYFPGITKAIKNPIPEDQAPEFAKKILDAQYGGLPSDAELQYSFINYRELMDPNTLNVIEKIPTETFVSWHRTIDGMRIEGGSDIIQVTLGDNGELTHVNKRWRTYEPLGNVSIISASKAIDKLGAGEVLNPSSSDEENVSIYNIHLSYYVNGIDRPEITLEPIWVFYGNTTMGHHIPFFVYARQFANFTATPTTGKASQTVTFTDTSDASPTRWLWDFGDGTNSTDQNPAHTYTTAGIYNVSLKAWNYLGSDTIEKAGYITVRSPAAPVADFTGTPITGKVPLIVTFTDTTSNTPTAWEWSFGDGYVSAEQNPVHRYGISGTYDVTLNATNKDGSSLLTKPAYITVIKPDNPVELIDQLIVYINNQNNIPDIFQRIMTGQLMDVKQSLQQNHPDDAVMGMKFFRIMIGLIKGWPLTQEQAATMQNSADAIIKAIDLPVNQAAIDQTKSLLTDVKNLNLPAPVGNPLMMELDSTVFTLECAKDQEAISYLNVFISSVKAQDGKQIPHDRAVQLVTRAQAVVKTIKP